MTNWKSWYVLIRYFLWLLIIWFVFKSLNKQHFLELAMLMFILEYWCNFIFQFISDDWGGSHGKNPTQDLFNALDLHGTNFIHDLFITLVCFSGPFNSFKIELTFNMKLSNFSTYGFDYIVALMIALGNRQWRISHSDVYRYLMKCSMLC